jgi:hypothetical protein
MSFKETITDLSKFAIALNDCRGRSVIAEEKDYALILSTVQSIRNGYILSNLDYDLTTKPYYKLWKDIDGSFADYRPLKYDYDVISSIQELITEYMFYVENEEVDVKTPAPTNMKEAIDQLVSGVMKSLREIIPEVGLYGTGDITKDPISREEENLTALKKPILKVSPQQASIYKSIKEKENIALKDQSDVFIKSSTTAYVSRAPSKAGQHDDIIVSLAAPGWLKSDIKITQPMANIIEITASKERPDDWVYPVLKSSDVNGNLVTPANYFATNAIKVDNALEVELTLSSKMEIKTTEFLLIDGVLLIYINKKPEDKTKNTFTVK